MDVLNVKHQYSPSFVDLGLGYHGRGAEGATTLQRSPVMLNVEAKKEKEENMKRKVLWVGCQDFWLKRWVGVRLGMTLPYFFERWNMNSRYDCLYGTTN